MSNPKDQGVSGNTSKSILIDRIKGCIYGQCLGDAYGLSTEFLGKDDVIAIYGNDPNVLIPFPTFYRNAHNQRWKLADWTDDSDHMILLMDSIIQCAPDMNAVGQTFAKKLKYWIKHGFQELGDECGLGCGAHTYAVTSHPLFETEPELVADQVWKQSGKKSAANGSVMRCSIIGCYDSNNIEHIIANSAKLSSITHCDPRCVASCVMTNILIAKLIQSIHHTTTTTDKNIQSLLDECMNLTLQHIKLEVKHKVEFLQYVTTPRTPTSLASLQLDEKNAIGYTFKCLGSGIWGATSTFDFKQTLNYLIREAGDADTNGAVCGAVWGAKHGYSALPVEWLSYLPHKAWLDKKVDTFLTKIGLY